MHRQPLLTLLRRHNPADAHERAMTEATIAFVEQHPNCFERSLLIGHVTGSAWIINADRQYGQPAGPRADRVLLIHHRKLDRWLQPGGHADGDPDVAAVAFREAQEETGLRSLRFVSQPGDDPAIFDVDVHPIPARGDIPEHLHYDIRFLLEADPNESFGFSDERQNIQWFPVNDANLFTKDESICRMMRKITLN